MKGTNLERESQVSNEGSLAKVTREADTHGSECYCQVLRGEHGAEEDEVLHGIIVESTHEVKEDLWRKKP